MLGFKGRDIGFDCDYIVTEDNGTDIVKKVMERRKRDHNLKEDDFTPLLLERIRGKMQAFDERD
jgi:predicted small metal-binding protein